MADANDAAIAKQNKGPNILVPMWALTAITTVLVVTRVWIRTRVVKKFGIDDWLIILAMVMGLVYVAITTANVIVGYGRHAFTLSIPNLEKAILLNTIGFLFGILSFAIPKIAVAAMLTRILNPSKLHKLFIFFLVGFGAAVSVVCIIVLFTMCDPPEGMWKVTLTTATCRPQSILINYAIFTGALSAFIDLYLAVYPAVVLWKLQMSLRKKVALSAALGLGATATAMAIVKCTQLPGLADKSDYTYGTWELVIWTNIESDVVIIASCIPTLQPLLELVMGNRKFGTSSNSNSRYFNRLGKDSHPGNSHSIEMKSKRSNKVTVTDVESQESILEADEMARQHNSLGQIRRTDDVHVQYQHRSEVDKAEVRGW